MFSYYVLYKPYQVLSQFSAEGDKKTLKDFANVASDVYPVGRLDYDSEGLLILTNDKSLNAALLLPQRAHARTYLVQVEGLITAAAVSNLEKGVTIKVDGKNYTSKAAVASIVTSEPELPDRNPPIRFRKNIPVSWISLTLWEGKNRQVRKMTAATGYPTLRLVRQAIGNLTIDGWQPGEMRQYTRRELMSLIG